MAQDHTKIHVGPGRIFLGVTPPATGTPPTLLAHVDGVPTTGTEVGHTDGDSTFTYQAVKNEITSEQVLSGVDLWVPEEMGSLVCIAQEHNFLALRTAFDAVGSVDDVSKTLFYGGAGTQVVNALTQCIVLTSRQRNAPTKFHILVFYKAYSSPGFKIPFGRRNRSIYSMEFKALSDTSRNSGDQMFQYYREK